MSSSNPVELWVSHNPQKFEQMLPSNLNGGKERFLRNMVFQIGANPTLRNCTPVSLIESCLQATVLGLDIGVLGQAYIVPYNTKDGRKAQFIPGYRGLLALARRSGKLRSVHCEVVCKGDEYQRTARSFKHEWDPFTERGEPIGVYAIFQMSDGSEQIETMNMEEIEAIRARSKASNVGPWVTDFKEMAKKTVLRRGLKKLDLRVEELERAIEFDNIQFEETEVEIKKRDAGVSALAAMLTETPEEAEENDEETPEEEEATPVAGKGKHEDR